MKLVDSLVGRSRELSNFELTDHLIARNRKRALQICIACWMTARSPSCSSV